MSKGRKNKKARQALKPRGAQTAGTGGDLGSVSERDAARQWAQEADRGPAVRGTDIGTPGGEIPWHVYREGLTPGSGGWRSWTDPGTGKPDPREFVRRLEEISPGLSDRLAGGLGHDELRRLGPQIARAMADAGAPPGEYSFSHGNPEYGSKVIIPGDEPAAIPAAFRRQQAAIPAKFVLSGERTDGGEGLPHGLQPGDIIAAEQSLGFTEAGDTLPGGGEIPAGSKVWRASYPGDDLGRLSARVRGMLDSGMLSADVAAQLDAEAVTDGTGPGKLAAPGDWFMPPALAGLPPDANVPVVISTSGERPPGAGEYLGRLTRDMHTESGTIWPAGARVYRNLLPPSQEAYEDKLVIEDDSGPVVSPVIRLPRTSFRAEDILSKHARLARRYSELDGASIAYLVHLLNASWEDDPVQALRMHWPVDRQGTRGNAEGRQMARLIGRSLREALTYQVTAPMVARMREAENLMPGVQRLSEGDLPAPAGFAWLDDPWTIPVSDGPLPVRAVSWEKVTVPAAVIAPGASSRSADAVRLIFWVYVPDTIAFGHFAEDDERVRDLAGDLGDLIPHHVSLLPFSYRFRLKGIHEDESMSMLALVHSLWTFLGMELSASRTVRPSGQAHRRTVLRSIRHDKVHVITLRRVSYIYAANGNGAGRVVNRTCKWWVDDFCRHIDPYRDEDENGRPRRHAAEPAYRNGSLPDDDHDVCGVCLARGQTVRITQVHGHKRGPSWLPWKTPAKGRTVRRLSR